ncbi:MAG TPA: hypothetical protein VF677_05760 [Flavobacterium sp.]|jgi:hypothetical protein
MANDDYPVGQKKCAWCGEEIDVYSNAQKYCSRSDSPECQDDRYFSKSWDKGRHPIQMEQKELIKSL